MAIRFTQEDWARVKETYDAWWNRKLDRPVIKVTLKQGHVYTGSTPLLTQATCHRLDISAEDVVERIHAELEQEEYLGDAFPMVNFDVFGPGVLAGFLGARLNNASGHVWFEPTRKLELKDMHFEYDPDNVWLKRIKDIYRAGAKKWKGNVLMSMPDLSSVLDVLAILRGTNDLLLDLYDEPEEVQRVQEELQTLWMQCYNDLNDVLQTVNPGYSDWSGLFSSVPSYVLQCDFSYMISPDMFRTFVADGLRRFCDVLPHTLYHLDGKGELPHLEQILSIKNLGAVQWCPGEGVPRTMEWPEVYQQIRAAGKNIHVLGNEVDFRSIAAEVGDKGLYLNLHCGAERRQEMLAFLKEYGVV